MRRDPSVTLRKFSPDTTGHGLRITKRPAVWYFSIFLFEKYQFLLEIFYLHLESSSASRKWKNLNVVLFADSVHRVSTKRSKRDTLKKIFFGFFQTKFKILQGNCKMTNGKCIYRNTVDYMSWMALEKDDFRRLSTIWEFRGPRRALHQGCKWPLNNSVNQSQLYCHVSVSHSSKLKLVRNQWKDIAFLVRFNVKQNFVFWHADRNLSRLKNVYRHVPSRVNYKSLTQVFFIVW